MAGFGKCLVEKSVCPTSVRIEKKSIPGIVYSKKKRFYFYLNGLVNVRCDHSAFSLPLPNQLQV